MNIFGTRAWACGVAGAAVILGWPLVFGNAFLITIGVLIAINLVGALSLHLIIRTGHVSLGHAAFMGLGGYTTALLATDLAVPFPLTLIASALVPALLALLVGPLLLRLTGKYFVLVTFMLGEIIRLIFVQWTSLTGGANGIFGIPHVAPFVQTPLAFYYVAVIVSALCVALIVRILRSEIGRTIDSVHDAERVAECSGVPALRLKVMVFTIASALVGIAGGLQVYFTSYVDPSGFTITQSLNFVIMNVVGGMGSMAGPVIGTIFVVALPQLLQKFVNLQEIIFGAILVVVMIAVPGGIVEVVERMRTLARRRA